MRNTQKACRELLLEKELPFEIRRIGQRYFLVPIPFGPTPRLIISWDVLYNLIEEM